MTATLINELGQVVDTHSAVGGVQIDTLFIDEAKASFHNCFDSAVQQSKLCLELS